MNERRSDNVLVEYLPCCFINAHRRILRTRFCREREFMSFVIDRIRFRLEIMKIPVFVSAMIEQTINAVPGNMGASKATGIERILNFDFILKFGIICR